MTYNRYEKNLLVNNSRKLEKKMKSIAFLEAGYSELKVLKALGILEKRSK
jgi:hypothetical protein